MSAPEMIGLLAFFAALTVFFLLYAVYAPVVSRVDKDQVIVDFENEEDNWEPETPENEGVGKYVRPILNNFMPQLPKLPLSDTRKRNLNRLIVKSGNPWNLNAEELIVSMIAFALIGMFLGATVWALDVIPAGTLPPVALLPIFAALGGAMPYSVYNSARLARVKAIEKELPEALDLLVITLGSGQSFEFALETVTRQLPEGTLKVELSKTVVELQAGSSLARSFKALNQRFDSEDLESFTKAVVQATKLGSDVSETLTHQSDYVRSNYEARLTRMINRLETTMNIPLIGTMLPAFMLILIAPVITQLTGYL